MCVVESGWISEEMGECKINICFETVDERTPLVGRMQRTRKQENDARRPSVKDGGSLEGEENSVTGREAQVAQSRQRRS